MSQYNDEDGLTEQQKRELENAKGCLTAIFICAGVAVLLSMCGKGPGGIGGGGGCTPSQAPSSTAEPAPIPRYVPDRTYIDTRFRSGNVVVFSDNKISEAFAKGSANLTEDLKLRLQPVIQFLIDNPNACKNFTISGFTDPRGSHELNNRLSQERADAVMRYIRDEIRKANVFVPMTATGYGKTRLLNPLASTEEDYAKERRITFECLRF